jgi:hypothetical protein
LSRSSGGYTAALSVLSSAISSNVNLPVSTTTAAFSTASLAVGTWLVDVTVLLETGTSATGNLVLTIVLGSATATLGGPITAQVEPAIAGGAISVSVSTVAVVTVAGTLTANVVNLDAVHAGTALAKDTSATYSQATGYTALRAA